MYVYIYIYVYTYIYVYIYIHIYIHIHIYTCQIYLGGNVRTHVCHDCSSEEEEDPYFHYQYHYCY
jgi:hypothetical protein